MSTELLYMDDWTLCQEKANVVDIVEREGKTALILDRTIFYPQGGGQPADRGEIISSEHGTFKVSDVRFFDGIAYHFGEFVEKPFRVGEKVELNVDCTRRELLSKLHSAGHLIDVAIEKMGHSFPYGKACHFPEGSYVEYQAMLTPEECVAFHEGLQRELNNLVAQNIPITGVAMMKEELAKICPHVPDYLPAGKPVRVVSVGDLMSCPCGGTHASSSGAIGQIIITKVKCKGGMLKVSYQLGQPS